MKSWGFNKFPAVVLILILIPRVAVSAQNPDSGRVVNTLLAPTILMGAGIATMYDWGWYSSQDAQECIQRNYPGFHSGIDDYLIFLPAAGVYGLNLAGVKGKHSFLDRSMMYLFSLGLATATSAVIKRSTGIERPDGTNFRSFPSNHSVIAFVSATFLHEEYKDQSPWYGIAGYTIATASGVLRMLNNQHWMSDVLFGAGLGILSTKVMYMLYPLVKESLGTKINEKGHHNLSMVPYVSDGHCGLYLQYRFR